MSPTAADFERLAHEHRVLLSHYGRVQTRCSSQLAAQAAEIEGLRAQAMRLRAAVIVGETALAWAHEDRAALEAAIPGLPRRTALARRVEALLTRIQGLLRERLHGQRRLALPPAATAGAMTKAPTARQDAPPEHSHLQVVEDEHDEDLAGLDASLAAADLVICQTGCLSHGAYWRVRNHCRRTGKACVLATRPDELRIVRIHGAKAATNPSSGATADSESQGNDSADSQPIAEEPSSFPQ